MTIRKTTIGKLQQLPEPLLQQVSDFIDQLIHQSETANDKPESSIAQAWMQWFEAGDRLEVMSNDPNGDYSQLLLTKYRQQGLEL
ncbi:MAG: hypothetical protein HC886_08370 [Leptolyngbyaceae cyanobacterium SM1_1_3]|nr:hypothetical protein [Leptolyngbyaceae cyanobacterium SM1_1_3]NJM84999.1 hypothetical protein [Leptolyngbyaceae cyanobacterium RM2_2_21]NJN02962.1 hypothetical protein [Leptolyngbyaceae cyanobacterium RM1_1_2]NJO08838.1 hypothetical protein [Leptolyngbyaceae cyanobacterium SL_1_1]